MSYREITLRRWQAGLVLLIVTAVFVVGLFALTGQNGQTRSDARTAKALAAKLAAQDRRIRRLHDEQIRQLHAIDVRGCNRFHGLDGLVQDILGRSITQVENAKIPGLTPAQMKTLAEINAGTLTTLRRGLKKARKVDCLGVAPLPTTSP